jgi:hypothetical protein
MPAAPLIVIALMILTTIPSVAQLRGLVGIEGGYRRFGPELSSPTVSPTRPITVGAAFLPSYGASFGLLHPLATGFEVGGIVSITRTEGSLTGRRSILVAVNGVPTEGSIRRDVTARVLWTQVDAFASLQLGRLNVSLRPGLLLSMRSGWSMQETIETPVGTTFVDGGSATRSVGDVSVRNGMPGVVPHASLVTALTIPISSAFDLRPGLVADVAFFPANRGGTTMPLTIGLRIDVVARSRSAASERGDVEGGVDVSGVAEPDGKPLLPPVAIPRELPSDVRRVVMDTVVVADTVVRLTPGRKSDSLYVATETLSVDTIRSVTMDTVRWNVGRRVVRLVAPPPALGEVGVTCGVELAERDVEAMLTADITTIGDVQAVALAIDVDGKEVRRDIWRNGEQRLAVALASLIANIETMSDVSVTVRARAIAADGAVSAEKACTVRLQRRTGRMRVRP